MTIARTSLSGVVAMCAALLMAPARPAPQLQFNTPVWITASWWGGATGAAIDRINRMPETPIEWRRQLCPPSKVILKKSGTSLAVINSCPTSQTFYLCATKGSAQPPDELEPCAQDPFETPMSRLKIMMLDPGPDGDFFNVTMNLSIQLFYCSDESMLVGPPARAGDPTTRARLACIGAPPRPLIPRPGR